MKTADSSAFHAVLLRAIEVPGIHPVAAAGADPSRISSMNLLKRASGVHVVTLNDGTQAVYKPQRYGVDYVNKPFMPAPPHGPDAASSADRAVAAHALSKEFGLNVVPHVARIDLSRHPHLGEGDMHHHAGGVGHIQHWITDEANPRWTWLKEDVESGHPSLESLMAFHWIASEQDGHMANVKVQALPDGTRDWNAIDHDDCLRAHPDFVAGKPEMSTKKRSSGLFFSEIHQFHEGNPISDALRSRIAAGSLNKAVSIMRANKIDPHSIAWTLAKIEMLKSGLAQWPMHRGDTELANEVARRARAFL